MPHQKRLTFSARLRNQYGTEGKKNGPRREPRNPFFLSLAVTFRGYSPKSLIFNCETIWYNCLTINFETFLEEER